MSFVIIDRRKNDKGKSTDNRQRFFKRVKSQVRESIKDVIANGSIKDISNGSTKKIRIPSRGLSKPYFGHDKHGGIKHIVVPKNKHYVAGDRIRRPEEGDGGDTGGASADGEGEDEFSFELTKEEFEEIFFEDLALPNLEKRTLNITEEFVTKRAGFSPDGNKLNIARTMQRSRGRRVALRSKKKKRLAELEEEYNDLLRTPVLSDFQKKRIKTLEREIRILKERIKKVPFIDTFDERYNRWDKFPVPTTKAVMIPLMDVSISMGPREKDLAKRFFMLLYWFLSRSYEHTDILYVRHTQIAQIVDEQEFFYSRETGGTVVSSGLELIDETINEKYPLSEYNIYVCQASDGDNWPNDSANCVDLLTSRLLSKLQYFAYVQIGNQRRKPEQSELWKHYKTIKDSYENFDMTCINSPEDIEPVFQKLFKKRGDK